jgi:hypothetical protein
LQSLLVVLHSWHLCSRPLFKLAYLLTAVDDLHAVFCSNSDLVFWCRRACVHCKPFVPTPLGLCVVISHSIKRYCFLAFQPSLLWT